MILSSGWPSRASCKLLVACRSRVEDRTSGVGRRSVLGFRVVFITLSPEGFLTNRSSRVSPEILRLLEGLASPPPPPFLGSAVRPFSLVESSGYFARISRGRLADGLVRLFLLPHESESLESWLLPLGLPMRPLLLSESFLDLLEVLLPRGGVKISSWDLEFFLSSRPFSDLIDSRRSSPPLSPRSVGDTNRSLCVELESRRSFGRALSRRSLDRAASPTELFRFASGLTAIGGLFTLAGLLGPLEAAAAAAAVVDMWPVKVEKVGAGAGGGLEPTSSPSPPSGRPRDWKEVGSSSHDDDTHSTVSSRTDTVR